MLLWLTIIFSVLYAALLGYYFYYWKKVPQFIPTGQAPADGFVSVIVAARNEAAHIQNLIAALQAQTLPPHQFEVIIVNDHSTDETAALVQPFTSNRFKLIVPQVSAHLSSKKKAIEAGVAAARGPLLVITDADCTPPPNWLEQMLLFYRQKGAAFIVAPVRLQTGPSLLGVFQLLDFIMLQGITAASVQAGAHSMCNGANLAYEKKAFEEVGGFAGIDKLASGDDMLLLYKIWKRYPRGIHYLKSEAAIMPTPAAPTWKPFLQQRIRWSSKATYYQDYRISAVLFFVYGFNLWFLVLLAAAIINVANWPLLAGYLAAKTIAELLLLAPAARFFGAVKQLALFPLLQPLHILYTVFIGLASRKGSYEWKGRITR